ncbi:DUF2306 domain-containing protein [Thalassotalea euphylliae]|uniref:DUF2306 domain-containing protein n=1 Tax=Thalassotalea euphylliae TaxID=1655234 RepID=A0A3E0UJY1_9GAMM|nr:DUF2306 domain-containing protein [Thalassotalea euphylliae]REL36874.1 DUF2306 domain-containing protein [Thalassotalea euphylliae]
MENTRSHDSSSSIKLTDTNNVTKVSPDKIADRALKYSSVFWFISILLGQWFFFYYIFAFYGFSVINDNMEIWNRWEAMGAKPYHVGDFSGNLAFAAHAIGAGIVAFGGILQLIPKLRNTFPRFHKVNGYVYLITVFCLAISGFYLVWIRDLDPINSSGIGTTINGFLILLFAYFTVRNAINRDIKTHRKWALRLFVVSNAQWTLRVGTFSYLITGNLLGTKPAFGDLFFSLWTFGCYLLPLAVLQLYFFATEKHSQAIRHSYWKIATSTLLFVLTILMIIGMVGFTPFLLSVINNEEISF